MKTATTVETARVASRQSKGSSKRAEQGSVTLVVAVGFVFAAVVLIGIRQISDAATQRARADAVADLVALAAVTGGRQGAEAVSASNEAQLVSFERRGEVVVVVVRRSAVRAVAAARGVPGAH